MRTIFSLVLFMMALTAATRNQYPPSRQSAETYLDQRGEVYISFAEPPDPALRQTLAGILSIDHVQDGVVWAYANRRAYEAFIAVDWPYTVHIPPGLAEPMPRPLSWEELMQKDLSLIESWDFYPTYDAYVQLMYHFEETHPGLVHIHHAGESVMGRDLLFARIRREADEAAARPRFMYTSTMHGDETAGFVLMLRLIHFLVSEDGVRADVTRLLDEVEIWICPNENPDGTYRDNNETLAGATRGNANGVDLNRNYPNPARSTPDPRQPETAAMIALTDSLHFVMSANLHGGAELMNYPFDTWRSSVRTHTDHNWYDYISKEYADTAQFYSPTGYFTQEGGYTHGGDWYVIYNSRQDHMNYYRSIREVTLELSRQKMLSPSLLPAHWEYNHRSFLNYIRQATYGISGRVRDAETLQPLFAEIRVVGHDGDYSLVTSCSLQGAFYRPIEAGTWTLEVLAEGYDRLEISGIEVFNHQTVPLDLRLDREVGYALPRAPLFAAQIIGNPLETASVLHYTLEQASMVRLDIFDGRGGHRGMLLNEWRNQGVHQEALGGLVSRLSRGVYYLRIRAGHTTQVIPLMIP